MISVVLLLLDLAQERPSVDCPCDDAGVDDGRDGRDERRRRSRVIQ